MAKPAHKASQTAGKADLKKAMVDMAQKGNYRKKTSRPRKRMPKTPKHQRLKTLLRSRNKTPSTRQCKPTHLPPPKLTLPKQSTWPTHSIAQSPKRPSTSPRKSISQQRPARHATQPTSSASAAYTVSASGSKSPKQKNTIDHTIPS
jgi:hypothetical protein